MAKYVWDPQSSSSVLLSGLSILEVVLVCHLNLLFKSASSRTLNSETFSSRWYLVLAFFDNRRVRSAKSVHSGTRLPGFKSWLYQPLAEWPWASYLAALCLSLFICKREARLMPISKGCDVKWASAREELRLSSVQCPCSILVSGSCCSGGRTVGEVTFSWLSFGPHK